MKCPICKKHTEKLMTLIPKVISVCLCNGCGLYMSNITPTTSAGYEFHNTNNYNNSIDLVRIKQAEIIVRNVKKILPSRATWLDIGCGTGNLLRMAKSQGYTVVGVDPDIVAIRKAQKLLGQNTVRAELFTKATTADNSVNVISALDLLEHIPVNELNKFVTLVHSKLKPEGLFVIKVPSSDGLFFKAIHFAHTYVGGFMNTAIKRIWLTEYKYPHTVYFNEETLTQLLKNNNFHVLHASYLDEVPNSTILSRLRVDNTISIWTALISVPIFLIINIIQKIRGKTDAMLIVAQAQSR